MLDASINDVTVAHTHTSSLPDAAAGIWRLRSQPENAFVVNMTALATLQALILFVTTLTFTGTGMPLYGIYLYKKRVSLLLDVAQTNNEKPRKIQVDSLKDKTGKMLRHGT